MLSAHLVPRSGPEIRHGGAGRGRIPKRSAGPPGAGTGRRTPRGSRRGWHGRRRGATVFRSGLPRGMGHPFDIDLPSCADAAPEEVRVERTPLPGSPQALHRAAGETGSRTERPSPDPLPSRSGTPIRTQHPELRAGATRARSLWRSDHAGGAAAFGALPALPFSAFGVTAAARGSDAGRVSE